jgi:hypothetical protein
MSKGMEVYTLFDTVFIVIYLGSFSISPGKNRIVIQLDHVALPVFLPLLV